MIFKDFKHLLSLILICLYSSVVTSAPDESTSITILSNNFSGYKSNIAKTFEISDIASNYQSNSVTLENWTEDHKSDLYIALGAEAVESALKRNLKTPVIAALITRSQWHNLSKGYENENFNALFYDPDPIRQIILIKTIIPETQTIGILKSDKYFLEETNLLKTINSIDLELLMLSNNDSKDFYKRYAELSRKTDSVLFVPDRINYNRNSMAKAILASYRQGKFVIGYSKGQVNSGALASTYTGINDYIKDLLESSVELIKNPKSKFKRFSKYYSVATNSKVAKSLGYIMQSNNKIKDNIEAVLNGIKSEHENEK